MKRAGHKTDFVYDEKELVGIILNADFTAEHEWGIERLLQSFDIARQEDEFGVEPRRVTAVEDENFFFHREDDRAILGGGSCYGLNRIYQEVQAEGLKKAPDSDCRVNEDSQIGAAWDSRSFLIYVTSKEGADNLETIYKAFLENDILIMLGGGWEAFKNAGLALGIISRIPDDVKQKMYDADESNYKLKQAAKATGIYDIVPHSAYFALSPRWLGEFKQDPSDTEYDVIFWLNPTDQAKNGFGWFTVEELTAWIKGEAPDGPIANRGRDYERQKRVDAILQGKVKHNLYSDERCCPSCKKIINTGYSHEYEACSTCGSKLIKPITSR